MLCLRQIDPESDASHYKDRDVGISVMLSDISWLQH